MKRILGIVLCFLVLTAGACTWRGAGSGSGGGMTAYDGVSDRHPGDAQALAQSTAQALALRYPPGHTSLALVSAPGEFGQALENSLRQRGFTVLDGEQAAAVRIAYVLDEIQGEARCYLQVKTSDGGTFGLVRELTNDPGVPVTEPPTPVDDAVPAVPALAERQLPEAAPLPDATAVARPAQDLPPHTVRASATAAQIARRNKVSVKDFCRWNQVAAGDALPAGYRVHLKEPQARAASPDAATALPVAAQAVSPPVPATVPPLRPVTAVRLPHHEPETTPLSAEPVPALPDTPPAANATAQAVSLPVASETPAVGTALPLADAAPADTWAITPGALRAQLGVWAARGGYQLIWKAEHDYDMEAHANFRGDFLEAVKQLFSGLQRVGYPLRVTIYKSNNVMEVMEN